MLFRFSPRPQRPEQAAPAKGHQGTGQQQREQPQRPVVSTLEHDGVGRIGVIPTVGFRTDGRQGLEPRERHVAIRRGGRSQRPAPGIPHPTLDRIPQPQHGYPSGMHHARRVGDRPPLQPLAKHDTLRGKKVVVDPPLGNRHPRDEQTPEHQAGHEQRRVEGSLPDRGPGLGSSSPLTPFFFEEPRQPHHLPPAGLFPARGYEA